jgi:hypothetical protein
MRLTPNCTAAARLPSRQRRGSDRDSADRLTGRARVGSPSSFPSACTDTRGRAPNDKQRRRKDAQRYHRRRHLERPSRRSSAGRRREPTFHQRQERPQGVHQMACAPVCVARRLRTDRSLSPRFRARPRRSGHPFRQGQSASGTPLRRGDRQSGENRPPGRSDAGAHARNAGA